jgi:hypothetical protein
MDQDPASPNKQNQALRKKIDKKREASPKESAQKKKKQKELPVTSHMDEVSKGVTIKPSSENGHVAADFSDRQEKPRMPIGVPQVEMLSYAAWAKVVKGLKKEIHIRNDSFKSLRATAMLKLGRRTFRRRNQANNIWCRVDQLKKTFSAMIVLFGICWRVEGIVENYVTDETGDVCKFQLSALLVLREASPVARIKREEWVVVSNANIGLGSSTQMQVELCYC